MLKLYDHIHAHKFKDNTLDFDFLVHTNIEDFNIVKENPCIFSRCFGGDFVVCPLWYL